MCAAAQIKLFAQFGHKGNEYTQGDWEKQKNRQGESWARRSGRGIKWKQQIVYSNLYSIKNGQKMSASRGEMKRPTENANIVKHTVYLRNHLESEIYPHE